MQSPRLQISSRVLLSSKVSLFLSCSQTVGIEQISAPTCKQNICLTSSCWYKSGLYFTGIGQCQPEVVDVSESSSCYTNSDSETEMDVCDEEVPTNSQASHCSDQLQSYQGFEMQYPKKTKTKRSRKIRTVNKNKPPTGNKKSAQKIYNKPERVRTLI